MKNTYIVLQAIGEGGTHYVKGSEIQLTPERAAAIGTDYLQLKGDEPVNAEPVAEASDDLSSLKLSELRKIATGYGLESSGSKTDLVERITLHKQSLSA